MRVDLGSERCAVEPTLSDFDCVRRSFNDVAFAYEGSITDVAISEVATIGEQQPLQVVVTQAFVQELVTNCCSDCEDDLLELAVWTP